MHIKTILFLVCSALLASALFIIGGGGNQDDDFLRVNVAYERCINCPHDRFLGRHLCEGCRNLDDAAEFSRYVSAPPHRNTVFFGHPKFEVKTYKDDRCGNIDGVPAAICTDKKISGSVLPKYSCIYKGQQCYAEHSMRNGHLFHNEIFCEDLVEP